MSKRTTQALKENNKLEEKLTIENKAIMTDLVCYFRSCKLSVSDQEMVRSDLINMLLDGQDKGLSAKEVFGEDYELFCDEVISELPKTNMWNRVLTSLGHSCLYIGILSIILLLTNIFNSMSSFPNITIYIYQLFQIAVIIGVAVGFVNYIAKNSLRNIDKRTRVFVAICIIFSLFLIILSMVLFKEIAFTINFYSLTCLIVLLFIIYKIIDVKIE